MNVAVRTYNRNYLQQTVASMRRSTFSGPYAIIDDHSDTEPARAILFGLPNVIRPPRHLGACGLFWCIDHMFSGCSSDFVIILEDDIVMHPLWYDKLTSAYERYRSVAGVVSGFMINERVYKSWRNTRPYRFIDGLIWDGYTTAQMILVSRKFYYDAIDEFKSDYDTTCGQNDRILVDMCRRHAYKVVMTPTSLCQHIGHDSTLRYNTQSWTADNYEI